MENNTDNMDFTVNRCGLLKALTYCLNEQAGGQKLTALALIDLKNFAQVNLRHGYGNGDRVLAELQQRLAAIPNRSIFCTRVDGDKFALIFSPLLNIQLIPLVAKKIIDQLNSLFFLDDQSILLEGHIGFSTSTTASNAEDLLQEAEAAAKQAYSTQQQYHISESSAVKSAQHQVVLKQQVKKSLSENCFQLYYQPQICLANNEPRGAESLIRWIDNNEFKVKPEQLIGIIEQSGHMQELFLWTVNTALRESATWRSDGKLITTAVNLSASCLRWPGLFDSIESSLNLWGGNPSNLCIEVTESTIQQDLNQGFKTLSKIKELGVKISIDDFGTGYSSLSYLHQFPLDCLKIDRSFINDMQGSKFDNPLVKMIIALAKSLDLKVVAEGIEKQNQQNCLENMDCDYGQGYMFSKPVTAAEIEARFLKE